MSRRGVLADHGLAVTLPRGWDGEIYLRTDDAPGPHGAATFRPILHAANFALPAVRGDYGGGAVEAMRAAGAIICLLEFSPDESASSLFDARGVPRALHPDDLVVGNVQRSRPGQAGYQRFCQEAGRAFCLYIVIGSRARRRVLVPAINQVLGSLDIAG